MNHSVRAAAFVWPHSQPVAPCGRSLRAALLGSACLIGLLASTASPLRADVSPCTADGATLVCSGDLALGIAVDPTYSALVIQDVTASVGSDGGVTGLVYDRAGALSVTSDTGSLAIVGSGPGLNAVELSSFGGEYTLSLVQTGDVISDDGTAIVATSWGDVTVDVTGTVSARTTAISAQSLEQQALAQQYPPVVQTTGVTVVQNGDVISYQGSAIDARAPGTVDVTANGAITANQDAIIAGNFGLDPDAMVSVTTSGSVTSWNGSGIVATSVHNDIVIGSTSTIDAKLDGIRATSFDDSNGGSVTITQDGSIIAATGSGILATANDHGVSITHSGTITGKQTALYATSTGDEADADVTIDTTGTLTSYAGRGISAEATYKNVDILSDGAITAKTDGIYARTTGSAATLTLDHSGTIVAYDGYGVNATAATGLVDATVSGAITAKLSGIRAVSTGSNATATVDVHHSGGLITSYDRYGIEASSSATSVSVTNESDIEAKLDGIHVAMTANNAPGSTASVTQTGEILTYSGYGISATATEAGVSITNTGGIQAKMGGLYGYASGAAANAKVTINNTGDIFTYDGSAIYALSTSHEAEVSHGGGTLSGGSYGIHAESLTTTASATVGSDGIIAGMNTAAVYLRGITGTSLTNYGTIDGGTYELALQTAGYGGSLVENYGLFKGTVQIDSGFSTFNNNAGGTYNVTDLAFNQGGLLYNTGTLSSGGVDTIHEAHIGGNFVQGDTGVLLIDASATEADKIVVAGNVELNGGLQLQFSDFGSARSIDILSSYWIDVANLTLMNAAIDASILYVSDTDVVLDYRGLSFGAASLTDLTTPVGDSLTAAYNAGSPDLSDLFLRLANITDPEAYQAAIDALTPTLQLAEAQQSQTDATHFADTLMSCPADASYVFSIGQSACYWARAEQVSTQQDATDAAAAYDASSNNTALGGQVQINDAVFLGFALGSKDADLTTGTTGESTQSMTQYGAALKYVDGPWLFAAALSGGNGTVDSTRYVTVEDLQETLSSSRGVTTASLRLRAANSLDLTETTYLKSVLDLNATRVRFAAASETGGVFALDYAASSDMVYSFAPTLELGTQIKGSGDLMFNPFFRLGAYRATGGSTDLTADFAASEALDGDFTISSSSAAARATLAIGLNITKGEMGGLNMIYSREMGDGTDVETIALKGMIRF